MADEFRHKDVVAGTISENEYEGIAQHIFNNQAQGDIMYASSAIQLSRLGAGTAGNPLVTGGAGANPSWFIGLSCLGDIITVGAPTDFIVKFDKTVPGIYFGGGASWDILLKWSAATQLSVRNIADGAYLSLGIDGLVFTGNLTADANAKSLKAPNVDDNFFAFEARDNTVGRVEVARLQGAADPYFQATLPLRFLPIATVALPGVPVEGMVTYNDTLKKLVVRVAAAWETVTSV